MREIEFTAKVAEDTDYFHGNVLVTKLKGEFVYGWLVDGFIISDKQPFPIDTTTVGQYVGVRDSVGNKIFEGDIVFLEFRSDIPCKSVAVVHQREHQYEFWHDNKFKQSWGKGKHAWSKEAKALPFYTLNWDGVDVTVIGNIHNDNAEELLSGEHAS